MSQKIAMIIPAAGLSTRHPPNKLLLKLGAETVIEKTVSLYVDFPLDIFIVIGFDKEKLKLLLKRRFGERIQVIENPQYSTGMASSIRTGILSSGKTYDYYGFCPGDKPFIERSTVAFLLNEIEDKHPLILVPEYEKTVGHPNFFSALFKNELLSTRGDMGGRKILRTHREQVQVIAIKDHGIVLDMDHYLNGKDA